MADLIKQKTKVLTMNKAVNYILAAFVLAAILVYMYLANTAVRTIAVLEKTKQEMQSLSVEVSKMESERLSAENNISTEKALLLGFVEVKHPTFIIKSSHKTALSLKID